MKYFQDDLGTIKTEEQWIETIVATLVEERGEYCDALVQEATEYFDNLVYSEQLTRVSPYAIKQGLINVNQ